MANSRIVLASQSPRRLELLQQIGLQPEVIPAHIDETVRPGESPEQYVLRMSEAKAAAVADSLSEARVILAADTAVVLGEQIFGKPESASDAAAMMHALSGKTHRVLSSVSVCQSTCRVSRVVASEVTFRTLNNAEIRHYWETGEPRDKAGGYAIQGLGAVFVESISGSYSAIMGLPLYETAELLAECGIHVF